MNKKTPRRQRTCSDIVSKKDMQRPKGILMLNIMETQIKTTTTVYITLISISIIKKARVLVKMWSKGNICTVVVGR